MPAVLEGQVFGIGNPLLDILVSVDNGLHRKYNLKDDDAILADNQHMGLYEEIEHYKNIEYAAGGATLNTIKMIQWILNIPRSCAYVGCIADDMAGKILKNECDKLQVHTKFEITKSDSGTGKVAVLLRNKHRSMVTHLGAAKEVTLGFVESYETWPLIERATVYYVAGYVVNSCFSGLLKIAKYAQSTGRTFCFNLSAPFLLQYFDEKINAVLPYVDILFGNKAEAEAYAEKHGWNTTSLHEIALRLASTPIASDTPKNRLVILTQDVHPVIVAKAGEPLVREYPVSYLSDEYIVDTTGAGDAFAAGFLADYVLTGSVDQSVLSGIKAAKYIIQRSGFTLGLREKYDCFD